MRIIGLTAAAVMLASATQAAIIETSSDLGLFRPGDTLERNVTLKGRVPAGQQFLLGRDTQTFRIKGQAGDTRQLLFKSANFASSVGLSTSSYALIAPDGSTVPLTVNRPENKGRGQKTFYTFELDAYLGQIGRWSFVQELAGDGFRAGDRVNVDFTTNFAVTPIPPALPLMASALGGLGWFARRRRLARAA